MNEYNAQVVGLFSDLVQSRRVPHAVLIEGPAGELRDSAVEYMSHYAVCCADNRPCGVCRHCTKAKNGNHSDIYTPKLSGKTNIINVDAVRELIKDASIICNEADTKVFILNDVDRCMPEISQNAFLKVLEEPPQSTLFILTAQSRKRLLQTILSRVQVFSLKDNAEADEETDALAREIVDGILSVSEIKLLYATSKLSTRPVFKDTLVLVLEYLRKGLSCAVGADNTDQTGLKIAKKLTKTRIIELIELTSKAIIRADRNVNMALLCTWLCGEYRRISWQR